VNRGALARVLPYLEASLSESLVRRISIPVVLFFTACGPPAIEQLCEDVSVKQCATCYSCEIGGAAACGLAAGADVATCERELQVRCVDQGATLERPKREIQECEDSLPTLTCESLVRGAAQNSPHTTDACIYFL